MCVCCCVCVFMCVHVCSEARASPVLPGAWLALSAPSLPPSLCLPAMHCLSLRTLHCLLCRPVRVIVMDSTSPTGATSVECASRVRSSRSHWTEWCRVATTPGHTHTHTHACGHTHTETQRHACGQHARAPSAPTGSLAPSGRRPAWSKPADMGRQSAVSQVWWSKTADMGRQSAVS